MTENEGIAVEGYLAAIEGASMSECDVLSPDVVLDATVPHWRFSIRGADAVRTERSRWYGQPGGFEELRRTPPPAGESGWSSPALGGGRRSPCRVHQAHILEVNRLGASLGTRCGVAAGAATPLAEMADAAGAGDRGRNPPRRPFGRCGRLAALGAW